MSKFALTPEQGETLDKFVEFSIRAESETFLAIVGNKVNLHTKLHNEHLKFPCEDIDQKGLDLPINLVFYEVLSDDGYLSISRNREKERGYEIWDISLRKPAGDYYKYLQRSRVGRWFEDSWYELFHESTLRGKLIYALIVALIALIAGLIRALIDRFLF